MGLGGGQQSGGFPGGRTPTGAKPERRAFGACHEFVARRVMCASPSSAYGDSETLPKREREEGRGDGRRGCQEAVS